MTSGRVVLVLVVIGAVLLLYGHRPAIPLTKGFSVRDRISARQFKPDSAVSVGLFPLGSAAALRLCQRRIYGRWGPVRTAVAYEVAARFGHSDLPAYLAPWPVELGRAQAAGGYLIGLVVRRRIIHRDTAVVEIAVSYRKGSAVLRAEDLFLLDRQRSPESAGRRVWLVALVRPEASGRRTGGDLHAVG